MSRALPDVALALGAAAGFVMLREAARGAAGVDPRTLFETGWLLSTVLLLALSVRLLWRLGRLGRALVRGPAGERGSVTVGFALTFPFFILIFSMVVQMSLLARTMLIVDYAAFTAARSAIVSLSADPPETGNIHTAAAAVLSAVSPPGGNSGGAPGAALGALRGAPPGPWRDRFADRRFAQASAATTVSWTPGTVSAGPEGVVVTLQYRYRLISPPASVIMAPQVSTIGGVRGRYLNIPARCELHSTGSRNSGLLAKAQALVEFVVF